MGANEGDTPRHRVLPFHPPQAVQKSCLCGFGGEENMVPTGAKAQASALLRAH